MNFQNMPDKLPKKHLFVAVQAVDNKIHETTNLFSHVWNSNTIKKNPSKLYIRTFLVAKKKKIYIRTYISPRPNIPQLDTHISQLEVEVDLPNQMLLQLTHIGCPKTNHFSSSSELNVWPCHTSLWLLLSTTWCYYHSPLPGHSPIKHLLKETNETHIILK